ncbi:MAG: dephospho-CoA kinase [Paludibacter sp.]
MKSPLLIGITGGIGSGKTTLSELLRLEGFKVYDSDLEARRLQNEHPLIRKQLVNLFGEEIYTSNGLNRSALAKIVFGKTELLKQLNSVVHPIVLDDFKSWTETHSNHKFLFMESAILFESGFNSMVDKVILIVASEAIRIARVVKRDGVTPEQVLARISHQLPDNEKIPRADFIIHSDDDKPLVEKMRKIVTELYEF